MATTMHWFAGLLVVLQHSALKCTGLLIDTTLLQTAEISAAQHKNAYNSSLKCTDLVVATATHSTKMHCIGQFGTAAQILALGCTGLLLGTAALRRTGQFGTAAQISALECTGLVLGTTNWQFPAARAATTRCCRTGS